MPVCPQVPDLPFRATCAVYMFNGLTGEAMTMGISLRDMEGEIASLLLVVQSNVRPLQDEG